MGPRGGPRPHGFRDDDEKASRESEEDIERATGAREEPDEVELDAQPRDTAELDPSRAVESGAGSTAP